MQKVPRLAVRGFRITRTIDMLLYNLLLILRDTLSDPETDLLGNQDHVDILEYRILDLLSRKYYVENLLWRNYKGAENEQPLCQKLDLHNNPIRVYDQAANRNSIESAENGEYLTQDEEFVFLNGFALNLEAEYYFYHILRRRPELAQKQKEKPTSMHSLLQLWCHFGSAEQGWASTHIKRDKSMSPCGLDAPFFRRTAEALDRHQREVNQNQATDNNSIATRRREEYGPFWFIINGSSAEINDRLSLFHDVLMLLPTPLPAEFAEDMKFQNRIQDVLETLNTRYGLLRSCGLDPKQWLDSSQLSINQLKLLKDIQRLRRQTIKILEESSSDETYANKTHAYERAFNQLREERCRRTGRPLEDTSYINCKTFDEFIKTKEGYQLVLMGTFPGPAMVMGSISLQEEDSDDYLQKIPDPQPFELIMSEEEVENYIKAIPDLARDALMSTVVRVVFAWRQLDEPEILPKLLRLIDENDQYRKQFSKFITEPDELIKMLFNQALKIIKQRPQRRRII